MAPQPLDVLTFGSVTLDIILRFPEKSCTKLDLPNHTWTFPLGDKIRLEDSFFSIGGGSANVARSLKRLGLEPGMFGTIGGDVYRSFFDQEWEDREIDSQYLQVDEDHRSAFSVVLNSHTGHRTVLHQLTELRGFSKGSIEGAPPARAIYTSHLYEENATLLHEIPAWKANNPGALWVWNPGKTQFCAGMGAFTDLFPLVDILILNREELEAFTQTKAEPLSVISYQLSGEKIVQPHERATDFQYDVREGAQALLDQGVKTLVVTDGDRGAQAFTSQKHYHIAAINQPKVDTLGAGDAFSAGVIAAFLYGKDLETALLWGSRNATGVIGEHGAGNGQLTLKEIQKTG